MVWRASTANDVEGLRRSCRSLSQTRRDRCKLTVVDDHRPSAPSFLLNLPSEAMYGSQYPSRSARDCPRVPSSSFPPLDAYYAVYAVYAHAEPVSALPEPNLRRKIYKRKRRTGSDLRSYPYTLTLGALGLGAAHVSLCWPIGLELDQIAFE